MSATPLAAANIAELPNPEPASAATAARILAEVRALVPTLRERAPETERLRRVPDATIRELGEIGVFKTTVPVEYGGYALAPSQIAPIFAEIARGCGSTGWVAWVTSTGTQWMTSYSERFQQELFGTDWIGPYQSGAMNKGGPGIGRSVPGGYMIKGKWPWASGCHHTLSHTMGALIELEGGGKEPIICQVPHAEVEILDDWHVMGMQGSGSNTIILREEVFVPEYRVIRTADLFAGKRPGRPPAGVLFKINLIQFTAGSVIGLGIGLARAALELLEEKARGRPITFTSYPSQIDAPVTHLQLGEMHLKLNAAEAIAERSFARMESDATNGVAPTPLANSRIRGSSAYALTLCHEIAETALRASGAGAIQLGNPMQRILRDSLTLTMHGQMNIETAFEDYGRLIAGLPGFGEPPKKKG